MKNKDVKALKQHWSSTFRGNFNIKQYYKYLHAILN